MMLMCRMLAIMSKKPIPPFFLQDFRLLAEKGKVLPKAKPGHKGGWGIVCYKNRTPMYLGRQPTNAMDDPKYEEACEQLDQLRASGILLAHLRKPSQEYKDISLENTAPFIQEAWCFAHNGTIHRFNEEVKGLVGTTDSERLFRLLQQEKGNSGCSIEKALEKTIQKIRNSFCYSSLTFVLSNGVHIYAYREYSDPRDSDYYNLMCATDRNMVILSQEPTWFRDLVAVPNRNLVNINGDLRVCSQYIP